MRIRRLGLPAVAIAALFALASCSSAPASPAPTSVPEPTETPSASESVTPEQVGAWHSDDAGEPRLVLLDDGTFWGNDGCNAFQGDYTRDGDDITFGSSYGTLKGCVGIDPWLRKAHSATINGDELNVFDDSEQLIGSLDADE